MSLVVYSGVPGSGKSYHAVMDMKNHRGLPVITNIEVSGLPNVAYMPLRDISPDLLTSFSAHWFQTHDFKENNILLILDECQLLFNNRTWNEPNRLDWLAFLSQHRKYGYKVIFCCQSIELIDKSFRCLCEFDYRHTSSGSVSLFTRAAHILGLKYTCAKMYFFEQDTLISRDIYRISRSIYRYYDTNQDITQHEITHDVTAITSQLHLMDKPGTAPRAPLAGYGRLAGFLRCLMLKAKGLTNGFFKRKTV